MKIHVAHILVEQNYEAEDLLKKLKNGDSFADLARKFSKCPSSARGGDLGEIEAQRLDQTFAEAALALEGDVVSPIVRTRFGYHLIKKIES